MNKEQALFFEHATLPGYRLGALEVYNWGTFHHKLWHILPQMENALLTGDIGSGKSTLVDAVTTLLVPHHKIVFNAAAGAQSKERTIRSYILGEYKNVREGFGVNSKPIALREANSTYSVLIARFSNLEMGEQISLAQVLWIEDGKDRKFFIVAKGALFFQEHFTAFGSDLMQLKGRLRKESGVEVFDSFKEYNQRFRQYFGMSSDKTLQLFYQTVSMKSVDNLTLFVRNHMLEESDAREQLNHLLFNFENLQQAHDSVVKARDQMKMLEPIVKEGEIYDKLVEKVEALEKSRMALPMYMAEKKVAALEIAIERAREHLLETTSSIGTIEEDIRYLDQQIEGLQKAYLEKGGNRINELKYQVQSHEEQKSKRQLQWQRYIEKQRILNLPEPENQKAFIQNQDQAGKLSEEYAAEKQALGEAQVDLAIQQTNLNRELQSEKTEVASLRQRKNQIPEHLIALRAEMMVALELREEELPFAGELLQVREDEREWEGAIERVLHGFGLSLLVSEAHYRNVSEYIERTNLKGRLVYFRTIAEQRNTYSTIPDNSLLHKIDIKPATPFEDWLEVQLEERYNYQCVNSLEEFRRTPYALTRQGQIKQGRSRHEKDDRRNIHDRRHYVLGWTNEKKIKVLEAAIRKMEQMLDDLAAQLNVNKQQQKLLDGKMNLIGELLHFQAFDEIDWKSLVSRIEELKQEIYQLENATDELAALTNKKAEAEDQRAGKNRKRDDLIGERGKTEERIARFENDQLSAKSILDAIMPEEKQTYFPRLAKLDKHDFSLEKEGVIQNDLQRIVDRKIELRSTERTAARKRMYGYMTHFTQSFPEDTVELQPNADYLPEMRNMYGKLKNDDLPKYEEKFKELLQKGTINDIALFKNKLEETARQIEDKIELINLSLKEIEYNPGTYILLVPHKETDVEIREFQNDLKNCLTHALGQESYYSEEKYLQVKKLLDRFQNEQEKRWREKVIDVRNWFGFGASEKNLETQEEVNYYSDSSGKSGGQKEKLAYTVLASALAYQYGIHDEQKARRAFRFVVIDEAFGRGSDESTRFGLELFKKMGLQLLVVTPMQKINVIQPYIAYVHYVSNPSGQNSQVLTLTREEFLEQQAKFWALINSKSASSRESGFPS